MGTLFLTDLVEALRPGEAEGWYSLIEVDGWQTRSRRSGGYDGRAKGVSHHHDAAKASADGWPSVNYGTFVSADRPIANLWLDRKGNIWICAAGATNTVGKGGPMGEFALDDGNAWQIGIEGGNDGVGEPWNERQVRAYVELSARLWIAYGPRFGWQLPISATQFFDHREWAPTRKIDRKGDARCTVDGVHYVFASGFNYWETTLYRQAVTERIKKIITPAPLPPVGGDMRYAIFKPTDCTAQFMGIADEAGNTLFLVWVDKARADAWQAAGVAVYDKLSLGGFINCVLLGPLPSGDVKHTWTGTEFFRVVS